jgi:hypothetical protein
MKGFVYRLGVAIKELGEVLHNKALVVIGLRIKDSV